MKLKSLIATLALATSLSASAVDITLSPVYTVVGAVQTALQTVLAPFALTAASSLASVQKEQIEALRSDAVDHVAGLGTSETLKASFSAIREKSEELNAMNDDQLAGLIITALQ